MNTQPELRTFCQHQRPASKFFIGSLRAVAMMILAAVPVRAATTNYLNVASVTSGGSYGLDSPYWNTTSETATPLVVYAASDSMTIGTNASDFNGMAFSINFNYSASTHLTGSGSVIAIGGTNVTVTFNGGDNDYLDGATTFSVATGSTLIEDVTWDNYGLNFNNETVTFNGGGTITFQSQMGANSTGAITENMPGGTVNLEAGKTATDFFTGGYTLTAGTLNFATTAAATAFGGFTTKGLNLNGGTIDNTSGSPLVLTLGTGTNSIGGNFTFAGSSSLDFGAALLTNTANHTVTVTANTLALGGVISGNGNGLTKLGAGTLLLYGASTYSGNTFVNAGTLALTNAGSISSSAQVAVSNATLDLSGLASGTTVLTAYSPTNSVLIVTAVSGAVTNVMATTLNVGGATNVVNFATIPLVTTYPTTFHLINAAAVNGTLNFGLGTLPSVSPAFVGYVTNRTASGAVDLVLTAGPAPVRALTWSGLSGGSPNGTWDVGTTPAWLDANHNPTTFSQLDLVTFNDSAAGQTTINLASGLTPGSLTVSNQALAYTFTGGNLSDGSSSLSLNKQGAGTLLLQESGDNFSGAINANGGTVIIDNDSSSITGGANVALGATLEMGTNDLATVNLPSGTTTVNGTLVFNSANNLSVANTLAGSGTVAQINTNIVTLSGTSSGNWAVNIQNGTMQAANNTALGSLPGGVVAITNGGAFDLGANGTQNNANFGAKQFNLAGTGVGGAGVIVNSAGVQQQNAFQNVVLAADATIGGASRWDIRGGTPILDLAGHTLTKTNGNQTSVVSAHVTSGNILIQQGILSFESTPNFDASAGTITVNNGGYVGQYKDTVGSFTRTIVLNGGGTTNLSGNGSVTFLDAPITLTANSTLGSFGGTEFFDGVISDGGNGFGLSTVGTGTNLLAATNTYSGITTVQGTLGLTNRGSIYNSPIIILTNYGTYDISGLNMPFSGTNALWVGDDILGTGTFNLGGTLVTNFNYLSLSNAVVQMAVLNPNAAVITVTNLNLGDGGAPSTINLTGLPVLLPAQFPLIKYANVSGTYNLSLGALPAGYSANLINNTGNNSIDLAVTGLPSGVWNGGSASDNNWSDAANWNGTQLSGNDALNFTGTKRLNTLDDLSFTETALAVNFLPGAGAFTLNGNPITLNGGITNSSASPQTINLGLSFGATAGITNYSFDGGPAGLILGGGLTNMFGFPGYTTLNFAGIGTLTNLLNSATQPGGTNVVLLNNANANWTLADNAASVPMTVPWDFQINAGTFNFGVGSSAPTLTNSSAQGLPQDNQVGNVSGAVGTLNLSNGTWTTVARLNTALASYSTGVVNQAGGTVNIGNQFQGANGATTNAQSLVTVSGGTMSINGGTGTFYDASRDQGMLTVSGAGAVNCGILDVSRDANGNTRGSAGVVNLNGGTLACGRVGTATANSQTGPASSGVNPTATFNFNGGTLKATATATNFFQGSTAAPVIPITTFVKAGGAIVDDGGFAITMLEPLQHDSTLGATPDGGLIKQGAGTNTLTAACTYTGSTVVSNGTLVVNGSLASASAVTVTGNGTLSGIGTVGGSVVVNGTITPGLPGTNGLLTCSANVTLNGTSLLKLNNLTNDVLVVGGTLAYGGALNVAILSGTPALNSAFKLFTAASYSGTFAVTNLPALGSGLAWSWNPANGTLSVVSGVNPNPTNLLATVSSGTLTLSWPSDHAGWTLQCQTNALGAGLNPSATWSAVSGSTSTNSVSILIDPSQPTVFYRLKY